eukprot:TRINITY_DN12600_c5_g1_i1.p1 TRINITY_DN12600_c5_g1~~TRINITY_DN12600_c5_g1_i1.p1  ORF type:complete len:533 (+),score=117.56 TRINITY_DN12600_c5_g1_i1:42-1640(+)
MAPKSDCRSDAKKDSASAGKAARKPKAKRSKNAYLYFSASKRTEVLAREGIDDTPANFVAAAKALAEAWKILEEAARAAFDACAMLDRCRCKVDSLRGAALRDAGVQELGPPVKEAVVALGCMPASTGLTCLSETATSLIEALERLDTRLSQAGRVAAVSGVRVGVGTALGSGVNTAAAALGASLGGRLVALLKKWCAVPAAKACVANAPRPTKPARAAPSEALVQAEDLNDETRSRVVGMLMRTAARGAGQASFKKCREVERALFSKFGSDPKEYRRRARSLTHNLGASDGALLQRVLEGTLEAAQLVRLEADELATDALKAERQQERERYFRSEVKLTARPPKRRRDFYMGRRAEGARAEAVQASQEDKADEHKEAAQASQPGPAAKEPTPQNKNEVQGGHAQEASDYYSDSCASSSSSEWEAIPQHLMADVVPEQSHDETASDHLLARLLQMETPSSCSSSSSSSSRSASPERDQTQAEGSSSSRPEGAASGDALQRLLEMGFLREPSLAALDAAKGNVESAIASLLGR